MGPLTLAQATRFRATGDVPAAAPLFPERHPAAGAGLPRGGRPLPDADLKQALDDALLPQLARRLDEEDTWGQKLSGGEQQRLAVARALLKKPRWLFVDEATSALDEAAEARIYKHLRAMVQAQHGALVSIAHRPTVAAFHAQVWQLDPVPGTDQDRASERVPHRLQLAPG
jgi:vitamin B12/bleomycin/antimicrobial peptide transport system ATP-binding/permease protein